MRGTIPWWVACVPAFLGGWWAAGGIRAAAVDGARVLAALHVGAGSGCDDDLQEIRAEIDEAESTTFGAPLPFPEDLDPRYAPDAFAARAARVEAECPELGVRLVAVDCDEFPCAALWERTRAGSAQDCPLWADLGADPRHPSGAPPGYRGPEGQEVELAWEVPLPAAEYTDYAVARVGHAAEHRFARRIDRLLARAERERGLGPP